jgi:hypothetical protein
MPLLVGSGSITVGWGRRDRICSVVDCAGVTVAVVVSVVVVVVARGRGRVVDLGCSYF